MAELSDLLRDQIRALIKDSGLKQNWIAARLNVSQKHLSQMLLGHAVMTLDWAQLIANACGYQVTVTVEPVPHRDDCPACVHKARA